MGGDADQNGDPDLQAVLDALDDPDCRAIIECIDEPMTAAEISDTCDIPNSTVYRKLEQLSEASLVEESTRIRDDGHHATTYTVGFEKVVVQLDEQQSPEVSIHRPLTSSGERLASMWKEVRDE